MKKNIQEMLQKRKKKKGLTLVELLAVIIVLAIIALIATPIVMDTIKDAKKGAIERSAERYLDAVETAIATDRLQNALVADGIYRVDANGNLTLGEKNLTVEVSGDRPKEGSAVAIKNGQVVPTGTEMSMGNYKVTIDDRGKATATEKGNVVTLSDCTLVSGTANTIGAKYSCDFGAGARNFYVLEVGSAPVTGSTLKSNEVALILEGNYDMTTQSWCAQAAETPIDNVCAADGLDAKLDEIAMAWTKLERSQIGLPSAVQVVVADGRNEDTYLDCPNLSCGFLSSGWLYSYPNYTGWSEGTNPPYGYWTSTPHDSYYALAVAYNGHLGASRAGVEGYRGVRPVITISKDDISL